MEETDEGAGMPALPVRIGERYKSPALIAIVERSGVRGSSGGPPPPPPPPIEEDEEEAAEPTADRGVLGMLAGRRRCGVPGGARADPAASPPGPCPCPGVPW